MAKFKNRIGEQYSTGVICLNTNRNFIGVELDEKYFDIAKNRINDAVK